MVSDEMHDYFVWGTFLFLEQFLDFREEALTYRLIYCSLNQKTLKFIIWLFYDSFGITNTC